MLVSDYSYCQELYATNFIFTVKIKVNVYSPCTSVYELVQTTATNMYEILTLVAQTKHVVTTLDITLIRFFVS